MIRTCVLFSALKLSDTLKPDIFYPSHNIVCNRRVLAREYYICNLILNLSRKSRVANWPVFFSFLFILQKFLLYQFNFFSGQLATLSIITQKYAKNTLFWPKNTHFRPKNTYFYQKMRTKSGQFFFRFWPFGQFFWPLLHFRPNRLTKIFPNAQKYPKSGQLLKNCPKTVPFFGHNF